MTVPCICTPKCDCQDPDNGFMSQGCPEHNEYPWPDQECETTEHVGGQRPWREFA